MPLRPPSLGMPCCGIDVPDEVEPGDLHATIEAPCSSLAGRLSWFPGVVYPKRGSSTWRGGSSSPGLDDNGGPDPTGRGRGSSLHAHAHVTSLLRTWEARFAATLRDSAIKLHLEVRHRRSHPRGHVPNGDVV